MDTACFMLCLFLQVSWTFPLYIRRNNGHILPKNKMERIEESNNFVKKGKVENADRERMERLFDFGRWAKGQDPLRYHRSQCTHMSQPWTYQDVVYRHNSSSVFLFKVFTEPLRSIFPQQNLFHYISRIYKCCKLGFTCKRIKGLQGTLELGHGKQEVQFYFDANVFKLSVLRAELHLEVSAPEQLTVIPELVINGSRHSRFTQFRSNHFTDLTLDVKFLLQMLKEANAKGTMNEEMTKLVLHCILNENQVPCDLHGVFLHHPPFIALQYD